jgi:hypothetical protein
LGVSALTEVGACFLLEESQVNLEKCVKDTTMKTMKSLGLAVGLLLASAAAANADTSDFALFDGTNPANLLDSGAVCSANSSFIYNVAVANWGSDGEVWITFKDGDIIRFPIAANASFAFSQAAGSKGRADRAVRVSNGGTAAQLSGSMSATGQGRPVCISCDADSAGDAGCDKVVPN